MSDNIYHIDPEAYDRQQREEEERAMQEREIFKGTLEALWDIALTKVATNKPIQMSDGTECCPHCGKEIDTAWWKEQDDAD